MRKIWTLVGIFALVALLAAPAAASMLTFNFNAPFPGSPAPTGDTPWLTATFVDVDENVPGQVYLTLDANLQFSDGFISEVYFNLDPFDAGLTVTRLGTASDGSTAPDLNYYEVGLDAYKADGDGYFDLLLNYPPPGGDRFNGTETVTYLLEASGLTVASFNYTSSLEPGGGHSTWLAGAHIQSISDSEYSAWIGPGTEVPVPPAVWLLGSGLIGLIGLRRKFK